MKLIILLLSLFSLSVNSIELPGNQVGAKASMCYMYGKAGGLSKDDLNEYLLTAVKSYTQLEHNYYVGLAKGILETTAFYRKTTEIEAALFLYIRKCNKE